MSWRASVPVLAADACGDTVAATVRIANNAIDEKADCADVDTRNALGDVCLVERWRIVESNVAAKGSAANIGVVFRRNAASRCTLRDVAIGNAVIEDGAASDVATDDPVAGDATDGTAAGNAAENSAAAGGATIGRTCTICPCAVCACAVCACPLCACAVCTRAVCGCAVCGRANGIFACGSATPLRCAAATAGVTTATESFRVASSDRIAIRTGTTDAGRCDVLCKLPEKARTSNMRTALYSGRRTDDAIREDNAACAGANDAARVERSDG